MTLRLHNTLTGRVDEFAPIEKGTVRLYTCGPTVYNYAHIGNLRTYVFEDILTRTLSNIGGYDVQHVMNVTDVGHLTDDADAGEDKMELSAARESRDIREIADFYWQAFRDDLAALNIREPDIWCRATEEIDSQIDQVRKIEEKGLTYIIEDDGVYFDTAQFPDYGKLAPRNIQGLQAGARVEMVAGKRNPTDFALWKFSPKDTQRLMEWPSPWGTGFPGWHIECSAMAIKYLGERLDIHCGGIDHINVHHTNEIAQAEAALGHEWCNWWIHGEFLTLKGKMAKSSGDFLTLKSLVERGYEPVAYRYFLLGAHYRQQLSFSWDGLDAAASAISNLKRAVRELRADCAGEDAPLAAHMDSFRAALADDLNAPRALAALWRAVKDDAPAGRRYATLLAMDEVLGLDIGNMAATTTDVDADEIERLIEERTAARKAGDFAGADEIRDRLAGRGIEIMDSPDGTTWRKR